MEQKIQQLAAPPSYPASQHATNGFSHGPSPAQVAAYCVIAVSIAVYFSCTYSLKSSTPLLFLYCLFGGLMVLAAAHATLANPTDRMVFYYKWSQHDKNIKFKVDQEKALFCLHCDSYCQAQSKHCRVCNRCVSNFDHHCMWFNNCVGDRNYISFFASLLAALAYATIQIAHTATASFQVDFSDPSQLLKIVLSWVVSVTHAVLAFMLGNLIILHIYLRTTNQTTYQFLQRKKKEELEDIKAKESEAIRAKESEAIKAKESEEVKQAHSIAEFVPERTKDKILDIQSEDSFAHTKAITVHPIGKTTEETPQKQNKTQGSQYLQCRRKMQDGEELPRNPLQHAQQLVYVESHEQLPKFLKKNQSLSMLLSQSDALSPTKQKALTIGSLEELHS